MRSSRSGEPPVLEMLDLRREWSISFAGCGFMGVYYVGVASCLLERFPRLIHDACKIYGASAGALMAAVLSAGVPLDQCCADLMLMARQARAHRLGPLHPSFDLLRLVRDSLLGRLPDDAHSRVSGRLGVSLTRVSNGRNVLASEFLSREELVEALICSCFVPLYCGVVPPTYRGVHYVDGAVSDNLPRCHLKNTITVSPYAGESDLCPRGSALSFHQVRFNNVSIQVNSENMYRVTSTFFPPEPEAMAEICANGYSDALRFLQENNLIGSECPLRSLETFTETPESCQRSANEKREEGAAGEEGGGLEPQLVEALPAPIRKVLCDACRQTHNAGGLLSHMTNFLPKNVTSCLHMSSLLNVKSAYSLAQRLIHWIPDVRRDVSWMYSAATDVCKQALEDEAWDRETPLRRSASLPSGLNLWPHGPRGSHDLPPTPEATPKSSLTFTWHTDGQPELTSLTPPPTPTASPALETDAAAAESLARPGGGGALGRALGWIRNVASGQTLRPIGDDGSEVFK